MAGISEGRYKDFLLQEIIVLGLERRWSAVDTCNTQKKLSFNVCKDKICGLCDFIYEHLIQCVCSDLVNAEVSHPENKRAGHELGLGALRGRRTKGTGWGRVYLPWRKKRETEGKGESDKNDKEQHRGRQTERPLSSPKVNRCALQKVCITAPSCAHTPWYLALGTSSTGLEAVCVCSTAGDLHLLP